MAVRGSLARKSLFRNLGISALGLIAAVGIPALLIRSGLINPSAARLITMAGVNAILAVSIHVITGITGLLSLGQAAFMGIGAYGFVFFAADLGLPLSLSVVLASLLTAGLGCLLGIPALKLSGDYLAMVTLGFGEIVRILLAGCAGGRQFEKSLAPYPALSFLTVTAVLALMLVLLRIFLKSSHGRTLAAIREDEIASNSYGIPIFRYKLGAFVIAAFIAGLGGCLYALVTGFIEPGMASFTKSLDYLIYAVFGGLGSLTGAVTASYALTFLPEIFKAAFSGNSVTVFRILGECRILIYALILIIVMISRPKGLLGRREFSLVSLAGRLFDLRRQERRSSGERRMSEERRSSSDRRQNNTSHWDNERRRLPDRRRNADRRSNTDRRRRDEPLIGEDRRHNDRRQNQGDRRQDQDGERRGNPELSALPPEGRQNPEDRGGSSGKKDDGPGEK
ncbi:hypothetical protein AGMMS50268_25650 [Spirochaetia bacterium]|nr:hypothetical protein AGMMS50268_25650 [Spirochaetia bacterium]